MSQTCWRAADLLSFKVGAVSGPSTFHSCLYASVNLERSWFFSLSLSFKVSFKVRPFGAKPSNGLIALNLWESRSKCGGQGVNRTLDTKIFSPHAYCARMCSKG